MSWLFLDDECSCFSFLNDILLTATKVQRTAVMREVTWRRKKKLRPYIRCNWTVSSRSIQEGTWELISTEATFWKRVWLIWVCSSPLNYDTNILGNVFTPKIPSGNLVSMFSTEESRRSNSVIYKSQALSGLDALCCWSCGMAISQSCPICQVCQVYYLPCVIIIPSLCLAMLWSSGVCKCQSGRYAILLHSDRNVFSPLEGVLIYPVPELVWSTCWSYCSWYSTWNSGHRVCLKI